MKVRDLKIEFDRDIFYAGEKVTGRLIIRTNDQHLDKNANAFIKFYDKLDIDWLENDIISFDTVKRAFLNRKKPFEVNYEAYFNRQNVFILYNNDANELNAFAESTGITINKRAVDQDGTSSISSNNNNDDLFTFAYLFEFQLPPRLQGTINLPNAKCNYYIKAYLTDDESVIQHYHKDSNAFSDFFKSLKHTFVKEPVPVYNRISIPNELVNKKHVYEAHSSHINALVTLPKVSFSRNEPINVFLEITNSEKSKEKFELHKISFKLIQIVKLTSEEPYEKVRLFDNLIAHKSRKNLQQNTADSILLEELIEIPGCIPSTSTRSVDITKIINESLLTPSNNPEEDDQRRHGFFKKFLNPIRVNYKLCIEFWKNFLVDDLDIKIPILIDPEE